MNLRVDSRGWFRRRHVAEDRMLTRENVPASMLAIPAAGEALSPDAALRVADVFACIRCLADTAASLPLVAYVRTADGGRERFTGRLADLLARPTTGTTTANLVGSVIAHLNLHGNCYLAKYRDARGTVVQIAPLAPSSVSVELIGGTPRYTVTTASGVSTHDAADILHIRALSTDGLVGLSPIRQAAQALGLSRSLAGHADNFARNAGRPGGILRLSDLSPHTDARDAFSAETKADFQSKFTGENAGKVLVIGAESMDYQQLALTMADAEFCAQRQLSTAEIARVFRVPPAMIGAPTGDSLTYSTVEGQARAFLTFSLAPWLTLIEQAISADSDLSPAGVYAEFLLDGLLRADHRTRADVYALALDPDRGWMTRGEVRQRENLPPEGTTNA